MKITLTPDQYDELVNNFWDISYEVTLPSGAVVQANIKDDSPTELLAVGLNPAPVYKNSGENGKPVGKIVGWQSASRFISTEDAILFLHALDERVALMAAIKALPKAQRSEARKELRKQLRQDARRSARKTERVAMRRSNRRAARKLLRQERKALAAAELKAQSDKEVKEIEDDLKAAAPAKKEVAPE